MCRVKQFLVLLAALGCSWTTLVSNIRAASADSAFRKAADEYIDGYLAWRPQTGTGLGLHRYDGKVTDFRKPSLDAELSRLKNFDQRLAAIDPKQLGKQSYYDWRILRNAIKHEIFNFEEVKSFSRNPMTYAGVLDVNIYIKRNFAPLRDRVRSIISILQEAPAITSAARANLDESLPKPLIETAIEEAN